MQTPRARYACNIHIYIFIFIVFANISHILCVQFLYFINIIKILQETKKVLGYPGVYLATPNNKPARIQCSFNNNQLVNWYMSKSLQHHKNKRNIDFDKERYNMGAVTQYTILRSKLKEEK